MSRAKILPTVLAKSLSTDKPTSTENIVRSLTAQSFPPDLGLLQRLSFTHFEQLFGLDSNEKRRFYDQQCLKAGWSVRELKHQISTLYYERTTLSTDRAELERQTLEEGEQEPSDFPIRDPYVLEFLGIKPAEIMGELEDAMLDKLQKFMMQTWCLSWGTTSSTR